MSAAQTTEVAQTHEDAPKPLRMTFEEWLAWDHEGELTEWVNGEVIIMSPPSVVHQNIIQFLSFLLQIMVHVLHPGRVLAAPIGMRLHPGGPVREPDLIFVSTEHLDRFTERMLEGSADLVVEVISDESVTRDRVEKFYEYQTGRVQEYWIIDPREATRRVDLYVLDADGRYQPVPPELGGIYRSTVIPGFWIRESWLWAEHPNMLAAASEIVGAERMLDAAHSRTTGPGTHNY